MNGLVGRGLGLAVFLIGICLLGLVFWIGWGVFQDPFASAGKETTAPVVERLTSLLVRLAFLLLMCIAASLIASKGIHLYGNGITDSGNDRKTSES